MPSKGAVGTVQSHKRTWKTEYLIHTVPVSKGCEYHSYELVAFSSSGMKDICDLRLQNKILSS